MIDDIAAWAEENGQELRETEAWCGRTFPTRELAAEHMHRCRECRWQFDLDKADSERSSGER